MIAESSTPDVWVYRDGRRREATARVLSELRRRLAQVEDSGGQHRRRLAVDALVVAGEIESGFADAASPDTAVLERVTDALAEIALGGEVALGPAAAALSGLDGDREIVLSAPEGFAYYGLHPEAYAEAALRADEGREVLVVGVRSIGTTLGAVARAALSRRGRRASRTSVRPGGTPFARSLGSVPAPADGAAVLVVDEGPGLSGSTFLAVAEAFVRAGVAPERIALVCSHAPDLACLRADDAEARWRRFRTVVAGACLRAPEGQEVSAGRWRQVHYASDAEWPASFVTGERRKRLSGGLLFKYEGLGLHAAAARERGAALAEAGFAHPLRDEGDGWASSPWEGRPLALGDLDAELLGQIGRYCARRASLFPAMRPLDLGPMIEKNARVLFDERSLRLAQPVVVRPAIVDARLAPHEWIRTPAGRVFKTDAVSHGDDHFFPGPTDIAWDLAGAIVEWRLDAGARRRLLEVYRAESGDDAAGRIEAWVAAYAIYSAAFAAFARDVLEDRAESSRFARRLQDCGAAVRWATPRVVRRTSHPAKPPESERSGRR